jgi:hypothetical protein
MADKKKRVPKKPHPVLIIKVPPAGTVERHEFAAKLRAQLRASQKPSDSRPAGPPR